MPVVHGAEKIGCAVATCRHVRLTASSAGHTRLPTNRVGGLFVAQPSWLRIAWKNRKLEACATLRVLRSYGGRSHDRSASLYRLTGADAPSCARWISWKQPAWAKP